VVTYNELIQLQMLPQMFHSFLFIVDLYHTST